MLMIILKIRYQILILWNPRAFICYNNETAASQTGNKEWIKKERGIFYGYGLIGYHFVVHDVFP